ncbi:MAG: tetratricopeptide repeat protein [Thermodesulfobacteriota bacterium]|nr:tetratricopeptide repeat protein [Thermodesulfobacteriota bacterium]
MFGYRKQIQTIRTSLLITGFCLFFFSPALAEVKQSFQQGKAAFEQGEFKKAFSIFQQLVQQNPGDPELDFLLGRSAYEIGNYETAIFAFERVLIAQPDADRVKLELGRSYFELGEFETARSSFKTVLEKDPPPNVRSNIERYLRLIDKASQINRLSGIVSLALSYDDNVYFSPIDDQIQTIDQIYTLKGDNATPNEDLVSQTTLALNHLYRQHPRRPGWLTRLLLYNASYFDEQSLNLNLLSLNTGPLWQQGVWQSKLQGTFNYLTLDAERYLTFAGVELETIWQRDSAFGIGLFGSLTHLNYTTDERDAEQYRLIIKPMWTRKKNRLSINLGMEWREAQDDQYTELRTLLKVGYERQLPRRLILNLGYRLQDSDYDSEATLFGKKRHDVLHEANLGLSRALWTEPNGDGALIALLNYVITDTTSNIDLYEYDKQVLSFSLTYLF